jgi:hypothetical protein
VGSGIAVQTLVRARCRRQVNDGVRRIGREEGDRRGHATIVARAAAAYRARQRLAVPSTARSHFDDVSRAHGNPSAGRAADVSCAHDRSRAARVAGRLLSDADSVRSRDANRRRRQGLKVFAQGAGDAVRPAADARADGDPMSARAVGGLGADRAASARSPARTTGLRGSERVDERHLRFRDGRPAVVSGNRCAFPTSQG